MLQALIKGICDPAHNHSADDADEHILIAAMSRLDDNVHLIHYYLNDTCTCKHHIFLPEKSLFLSTAHDTFLLPHPLLSPFKDITPKTNFDLPDIFALLDQLTEAFFDTMWLASYSIPAQRR